MKHITILLLFISLGAHGQLVKQEETKSTIVGQVNYSMTKTPLAILSFRVFESDTMYSLTFRNVQYTHIDDYKQLTWMGKQTTDQLYETMLSFFSDPTKQEGDYSETYTLGNDRVTLRVVKNLGIYQLLVYTDFGSFVIQSKQLDKLFDIR